MRKLLLASLIGFATIGFAQSDLSTKLRNKDLGGRGLSKNDYNDTEKGKVSDLERYNVVDAAIIENFYVNGGGNEIAGANQKYSIIPAVPGDSIRVTSTISGGNIFLAVYINSSGAVISLEQQGTNGVWTTFTDYRLTIPANTVRVVIHGDLTGPLIIRKKGKTVNSYSRNYTVAKTQITNGVYINSSGTFIVTAGRKYTTIPVSGGEWLRLTGLTSGAPVFFIMFRTATGTLKNFYQGANGRTDLYTQLEVPVPYDAVEAIINHSFSSITSPLVVEKSSGGVPASSGKNILWFGTSIPSGGRYPEWSSYRLGALAINNALGSSMVRKAKKNGSCQGLAWQNFAWSLSHTISEKIAIINNWAIYKDSLTNSPPTTLSSADTSQIIGSSYQKRLLPYLNGTIPMPDIFVFDHGHNDNLVDDTDSDFTTVPTVRNNRNYFLGGMNFLIDLILQYNPRAKIVFIGHYENAQKTRISTAQITLAEYWDFPLLRLWERTGFSQQISPGSQTLWATSPYNLYTSGQNTAADMTIQNVWLPDRLHPHTDTSNRVQTHLTNIVYEFLRGLF